MYFCLPEWRSVSGVFALCKWDGDVRCPALVCDLTKCWLTGSLHLEGFYSLLRSFCERWVRARESLVGQLHVLPPPSSHPPSPTPPSTCILSPWVPITFRADQLTWCFWEETWRLLGTWFGYWESNPFPPLVADRVCLSSLPSRYLHGSGISGSLTSFRFFFRFVPLCHCVTECCTHTSFSFLSPLPPSPKSEMWLDWNIRCQRAWPAAHRGQKFIYCGKTGEKQLILQMDESVSAPEVEEFSLIVFRLDNR